MADMSMPLSCHVSRHSSLMDSPPDATVAVSDPAASPQQVPTHESTAGLRESTSPDAIESWEEMTHPDTPPMDVYVPNNMAEPNVTAPNPGTLVGTPTPTSPMAEMYKYDPEELARRREKVFCPAKEPHKSGGTMVKDELPASLMGPAVGERTNAVGLEVAVVQPDTAMLNVPTGSAPGSSHTLLVIQVAVAAAPVVL